ncbi:SpoIIE family protein phosphatase [Streptomyces puniciscabiei]
MIWGIRRRKYHKALIEALLHDAPVGIAAFDSRLRFVLQNSALQRESGLTNEQRYGRTIGESLPGVDWTAVQERQRNVFESGQPQAGELRGTTPSSSGREQVWAQSIFPLRNRTGETFGVGHAVLNITERVRARERLIFINEISSCVGSTLDVIRTAQELTDAAVGRFADLVFVDLLEDVIDGKELAPGPMPARAVLRRAACGSLLPDVSHDIAVGDVVDHASDRTLVRAFADSRPVLETCPQGGTSARSQCERVNDAAGSEQEWQSRIVLPVRARGIPLGVAVFTRSSRMESFEQDDVLLAEEIVARAAVCIDNGRRYAHQRATALALQRSLLPHGESRQIALDIASRYVPGAGEGGLGGDWFDVIPLSGSRVALVVGDVVGHDQQAAIVMGQLRTAVRTLADLDLQPDELLTHLDHQVRRLIEDGEEGEEQLLAALTDDGTTADDRAPQGEAAGLGCTCLYAIYDPISRRCSFARAGHLPPAVVSPDGTVRIMDLAAGPPLGLGGLPFEKAEIEIAENSLLALYTDGLIDARHHQDLDARLEQLRSALTCRDRSLDSICEAVIKALVTAPPADDIALMVARTHALGPDQCATWDLANDVQEVGNARAHVDQQLETWGLCDLAFTTDLIVSELVTNAIRYGSPPIQLRLIKDHTLICEVSDGSSTSPHLRRARITDEGGRGLFLVAQCTQSWGTRYSERGKTIWAEQALPSCGSDGFATSTSRGDT